MTIWWILVPIILLHVAMAFVAAPPNAIARRVLKKFELHQQLYDDLSITVTFGDTQLEGDEKQQIIHYFNDAVFGYRYYKIPGSSGTPLVIHTKQGKHEVKLFLYSYENRVDVFKEYKNSVLAYRLVSESLQEFSISSNSAMVSV